MEGINKTRPLTMVQSTPTMSYALAPPMVNDAGAELLWPYAVWLTVRIVVRQRHTNHVVGGRGREINNCRNSALLTLQQAINPQPH